MLDLQGYGPRLIEGAGVTIQLAVLSLILAILLGLLTATAKMSRNWFLHRTATVYTTVIRGVPDLVLMMLLFFYNAVSGLTLYIMTSTFAGVAEQYVIRRHIERTKQNPAAARAAAATSWSARLAGRLRQGAQQAASRRRKRR